MIRAEPATPESIRASRRLRGSVLTTDDGVTYRIAPRVHCRRSLQGWLPVFRTLIKGATQ